MQSKIIPMVTQSLLDELDRLYPVHTIKPNDNINDIMFKAGIREVINRIKLLSTTMDTVSIARGKASV